MTGPAVLMRAPVPPGTPALVAARLAALLARHGITHVYTTADQGYAVVSVSSDLTAWTDGRRLWYMRGGRSETWHADDTTAAAARLATLARALQDTQPAAGTHPPGIPGRTDDMNDAPDEAAVTGSRDPFAVDQEHARDALTLAWGDQYDQIWFHPDVGWAAHHKDAAVHDILTGNTPDELNRAIRADWQHRAGQP